jgi:transposase
MEAKEVRRPWQLSDELWAKIAPLIPPGKPHPLGCHNSRVPDRRAMEAILFVLRTGCQWNALNATEICSSSSAHRRFQEWIAAGVFLEMWKQGLCEYDELKGIAWDWQAMDGAMTKAPLGGEKNRPQSDRSRQARHKTQPADRRGRDPAGGERGRGQPQRLQDGPPNAGERPDPPPGADAGATARTVLGQGL